MAVIYCARQCSIVRVDLSLPSFQIITCGPSLHPEQIPTILIFPSFKFAVEKSGSTLWQTTGDPRKARESTDNLSEIDKKDGAAATSEPRAQSSCSHHIVRNIQDFSLLPQSTRGTSLSLGGIEQSHNTTCEECPSVFSTFRKSSRHFFNCSTLLARLASPHARGLSITWRSESPLFTHPLRSSTFRRHPLSWSPIRPQSPCRPPA